MPTDPPNKSSSPKSLKVRNYYYQKLEALLICFPRIDALSERLARLEKTGKDDTSLSPPTSFVAKSEPIRNLPSPPKAPQYDPVKSSTKRKYPTASSSISDSTSPSNPLEPKRRASAGAVAEFRNERHPLSATHQATEAREYLDNELQCNPALSQDRRSALESARKFVGQLTNPCFTRHVGIQEEFDIEEDLPRPTLTPELLYMMLPGEYMLFNIRLLLTSIPRP